MLILERESSGELLYKTAGEILRDQERRRGMSAAMAALGSVDAAEKIYTAMMALRGPQGK